MVYRSSDAIKTIYEYLNIDSTKIKIIEKTNERGFVYCLDENHECVIFVYPISCKRNNKQNFFDTRDSGVAERKIAWDYAKSKGLKYFCLGVNSQQSRYKNYIFSLESSEKQISDTSFRKTDGDIGTGTQITIPATLKPCKSFERIKTTLGFYVAVIEKTYINDYLKYFDNRPYFNNDNLDDQLDNGIESEKIIKNNKHLKRLSISRCENGYNMIYYGIPGCGKSYMVEEYLKKNILDGNGNFDRDKYKKNIFRTTFYLDYTNSDFIGQILPIVKEDSVCYEYIAGPFVKALNRSYETDDMVYLVIEEINRGNAAAIFGDLFQLLDRLDERKINIRRDNGNHECKIGDSEYSINNQFIQEYLKIENEKVMIPSNLTILATMNTNDQNVFPLDTAFKRRWKMKRIVNTWENHKFKDYYIPFTDITWQNFVEAVNKKMLEASDDGLFLEDKQLGAYFVSEDLLVKEKDDACIVNDVNKEKLENFTNKVIEYLYNDVFKFDKGQLFDNKKSFNEVWECINSYDEDDCFNGSKNLCLNINFYNDSEQSI
ncbi:AAA family ATPase [Thomasclavelia spiroformis]|uniref:AAA family ATPase n=1 Tax=Thomasclavelia spiroformis TaxID=29348 RepID=UPI00241C2E11|nr:AAA family ATPase [Thomasclavelia spiroformis]